MKFSASVVAFLAVASSAAAVKEGPGQDHPIFKNGHGYSLTPGQAGSHAKRAALAVADALAVPEAHKRPPGGRIFFCSVPGSSCNEKREAEARAPGGRIFFCSVPGSSCNEKRHYVKKIGVAAEKAHNAIWAREAEAEIEARRAPGGKIFFCSVPGSSCNEKRDASARAPGGKIFFCSVPGSSCNEKRSEESFREHETQHGPTLDCGVAGVPCSSEEDVQNAKRAVDAINKFNPEILKNECYAEGNECDQIVKAHKAFQEVKRSEESAAKEWSASAKTAYCGSSGCGPLAHAHLKAASQGQPEAKSAEAACHGPSGACTLAARALDELETAINEGVASLNEM